MALINSEMKRPAPHSRLHWGILMQTPRAEPMLLFTAWDDRPTDVPDSEPARALLFRTRQQARDWRRAKLAAWDATAICEDWRLQVVRVRETVEVEG